MSGRQPFRPSHQDRGHACEHSRGPHVLPPPQLQRLWGQPPGRLEICRTLAGETLGATSMGDSSVGSSLMGESMAGSYGYARVMGEGR